MYVHPKDPSLSSRMRTAKTGSMLGSNYGRMSLPSPSPFLLARPSQKSEGILLSIYLHGVHVHPAALDSPHTLGLYTATNAYLLRAPSSTLAEQWRCVSRLTQCRPLVGARPTP
mgnify:CR=1 FL=1